MCPFPCIPGKNKVVVFQAEILFIIKCFSHTLGSSTFLDRNALCSYKFASILFKISLFQHFHLPTTIFPHLPGPYKTCLPERSPHDQSQLQILICSVPAPHPESHLTFPTDCAHMQILKFFPKSNATNVIVSFVSYKCQLFVAILPSNKTKESKIKPNTLLSIVKKKFSCCPAYSSKVFGIIVPRNLVLLQVLGIFGIVSENTVVLIINFELTVQLLQMINVILSILNVGEVISSPT